MRLRGGFLRAELLAAAAILAVAMSFFARVAFQNNLLWKDIGQHRAAMNELSNQLEVLTRLPVDEARQAIDQLQPSRFCQPVLVQPDLSGTLEQDPLGHRLDLQISWKGPRGETQSKQLSGWIVPKKVEGSP